MSIGFTYPILSAIAISIVSWFAYQGYLETRVNSPLSEEKVVLGSTHQFPERYWGSFRPGTYFGLKTRDSESLLTGLMWFMPDLTSGRDLNIRYVRMTIIVARFHEMHIYFKAFM